jgi:hypothetical protein
MSSARDPGTGGRGRGRHAAPGGSFWLSLLTSPLMVSALLGILVGVVVGLVWWQSRTLPEPDPTLTTPVATPVLTP